MRPSLLILIGRTPRKSSVGRGSAHCLTVILNRDVADDAPERKKLLGLRAKAAATSLFLPVAQRGRDASALEFGPSVRGKDKRGARRRAEQFSPGLCPNGVKLTLGESVVSLG